MKQSKIFFILIGGLAALSFLFFWNREDPTDWATLEGQTTYYYGENCPHCHRVFQFIESNRIGDRVPFIKKEASLDLANGREFLAVAKKCGLEKTAGFPLVYAEGKCFMGEPDVIAFFKRKAGINQ